MLDDDMPKNTGDNVERGRMDRRDFLRRTGALGAAVPFAVAAERLSAAQQKVPGVASPPVLDLAEWTQGYVGVETITLARGDVFTGKYLSVECWTPRQIRRPFPVIFIHGGTGQGLDWMTTPDGRRGWALQFVEQGYKVYVVDRPGQGRPPYIPDVHGAYPAQAPTFEQGLKNVAGSAAHTQWPGSIQMGDSSIGQFMASQGPALADGAPAEVSWRFCGGKLLDETGPAIFVTHGDGARFAMVAADERPALVKAIVALEVPAPFAPAARGGPGFPAGGPAGPTGPLRMTATPLVYDKWKAVAIAVVTPDASAAVQRDPQTIAFLQQAGLSVDQVRLTDAGIRGNGPFVMLEKNNREAAQPVLAWLDRRFSASASSIAQPVQRSNIDSTALRLADQGYMFVGVKRKTMPYGTVAVGQSGVQSFIPADVRHPFPIVLIHGGGGQATHMTGIGRRPGWLHYFVREGYRVYVMDRPAYGRVPLHPDTFGADYIPGGGGTALQNILRNSPLAPGAPRNTGLVGEDVPLQFAATEAGNPRRMVEHTEHWLNGMTELLDAIGPSVVLTHAYSGTLGFAIADRRPALVKALVTVEGNNNPFEAETVWGVTAVPVAYDPPISDPKMMALADWTPPAGSPGPVRPYKLQAEPARQLKNLKGIPMLWVQGENAYAGPAQVRFLQQAGCSAEFMRLRDRGMPEGNTNLMPLERNNFDVFGLLRDWIGEKVRG